MSSSSGFSFGAGGGGATDLQTAYDGGATIVTAGAVDVDFTLTAGDFVVNGGGSVDFGSAGTDITGFTVVSSSATTIDAAGGFSIDGTGAGSNVTSTEQALTIGTITSGLLTVSAAASLDLSAVAVLNIDGDTVTMDSSGPMTLTVADGQIMTLAGGDGSAGLTISAAGAVTLVSETGQTVDITSGGATTWNTTAGDLTIGGASQVNALIFRSVEAAGDAIQINASSASGGVTMNFGSGGYDADSAAITDASADTGTYTFTTGALTGSSASARATGSINFFTGNATNSGAGAGNSGAFAVTTGTSADTRGAVTFTGGDGTWTAVGSVDIDCSGAMSFNSSAGVINIGDDAVNQDMNIGSGGTRTIAIGSATATVNVSGSLNSTGGRSVGVTALTSVDHPYTVLVGDSVILCDCAGGTITVSLPAADTTGRLLLIKKIDSSINGVTIDPDGAETIDGEATRVFGAQYEAVTVVDGSATDWSTF